MAPTTRSTASRTATGAKKTARSAKPAFPSFDFSSLDSAMFAQIDDKLVEAARDAAYITIGFGVLAFQQAQVRRRELLHSFESRLGKLDDRLDTLETKLDATVEKLEDRLPEQAAAIVGQAHELAKAARQQVRGLIRNAA